MTVSLPPTWAETDVGSICDVVGGGTPSTKRPDFWDGGIPWISSADIYGLKDVRPRRSISELAITASATNLIPQGSIVVVTRVGLGKVALAQEPLCFSQDSQGLLFNSNHLHDLYLAYYLSQAVQSLRHIGRGTTISGVTKRQLRELPILLPPLPEQRRIVAAIEHHFSRLDAAVASLERAQANLKRYRTSVLKAACDGELVPTEAHLAKSEGRDYEPADQLLARILAERRARWETQESCRGKYKEPVAPDTSNLPDLPEGWVWSRFDQVVSTLEGGTAVSATNTRSNRPVLRSSAVRQGLVDYEDFRYLPDGANQGPDPYIATGDLLFTRLSGTLEYVGNCAVVGELRGRKIEFPDRIFRGRCVAGISPTFVQITFAEKTLRRSLEAKAKSSAGHQRISLSDLREYCVPLPPLAEQRRIVAEVERRLSAIQQAEAAVEANLARAERLRQSILKQAFSGKLVPQNPTDEPASALLDRIRAERETRRPWQPPSPGASRIADTQRRRSAQRGVRRRRLLLCTGG